MHEDFHRKRPGPCRSQSEERRRVKQESEIVLSHAEASASLRLIHATTYRSAQGITLKDRPLLLLDTVHAHFEHRMFIVGLSRVASREQLAVATMEQQRDTVGFCGKVRGDDCCAHEDYQPFACNYVEDDDAEIEEEAIFTYDDVESEDGEDSDEEPPWAYDADA